eukprot:6212313-Pleurochrysis_carterae.AAC.8
MLDEGKAWGEALEPLPPRQAALFARTLAADAKARRSSTRRQLPAPLLLLAPPTVLAMHGSLLGPVTQFKHYSKTSAPGTSSDGSASVDRSAESHRTVWSRT